MSDVFNASNDTTNALLRLEKLSLSFGGLKVLQDISLTVTQSEVLALIGPNGAGKSALINCISGVYRATSGSRISLAGQRLDHLPPHRISAAGISRTFQGLQLANSLSVLDNILLGLVPRFRGGMGAALLRPLRSRHLERQAQADAREIASQCRLDDLLHVQCSELPLGVLRRVDLARALVSHPKLLLLDEPASGLSHDERPLIGEMVNLARSRRGLAVLWIEHDLELVLNQAERAIVLHHGELIGEDDPRNPEGRTRIVSAYKNGHFSELSAAA